jgi:transposase
MLACCGTSHRSAPRTWGLTVGVAAAAVKSDSEAVRAVECAVGAGDPDRTAADNRQFVDAVLWVLRSGARWSDLPERYGKFKPVHKRFIRWAGKGVWEPIFALGVPEGTEHQGSPCRRRPRPSGPVHPDPGQAHDVTQALALHCRIRPRHSTARGARSVHVPTSVHSGPPTPGAVTTFTPQISMRPGARGSLITMKPLRIE